MVLELFILLLAVIVETPTAEMVSLTQVSPPSSGSVCPGQDLVYKCTSNVSINVLWRETALGGTTSQETNNLQKFTLPHFMGQVISRTFVPSFSIVSTATLKNALLSHNNVAIQCYTLGVTPVLNGTATVSVSGASSHPTNLTLAPQSVTSVLLSWLPPTANQSNCSFSYAISSNGSLVAQYRTNTTSLTVTDLNVTTKYYFTVAVEDASLATGPWSEMVDILWNVPQAIVNISLVMQVNVIEATWMYQQMENILHPPIDYYTITHNITDSGATVTINVTSTVAVIPINGVPPGHYYIAVAAVNIVGEGERMNEAITVIAPANSIVSTPSSTNKYLDSDDLPLLSSTIPSVSSIKNSLCMNLCDKIYPHFSQTPVVGQVLGDFTIGVTVSAVVSGVLSAISASIITTIIVSCVMRRGTKSSAGDTTAGGTQHELTPAAAVVYDVINEQHKEQTISTQDNVAYGGIVPLKQQNVAYEEVHIV